MTLINPRKYITVKFRLQCSRLKIIAVKVAPLPLFAVIDTLRQVHSYE
jgi:hypothetical protein